MEKIIIISKDEAGVIARVAQALDEAGVNIKSLDTERAGEQGIISLTTDGTDIALRALARAGFHTTTGDFLDKEKTQIKVVELPATPELLAREWTCPITALTCCAPRETSRDHAARNRR